MNAQKNTDSFINSELKTLIETKALLALRREIELEQQARQVAHDIQSPLMALNHLARSMERLDPSMQLLVQSITARIRDIVGDLLERHNPDKTPPYRLSDLINAVLMEKAIEKEEGLHQTSFTLSVNEQLSSQAYSIRKSDLHRILSNALNNSFEASSTIVTIRICAGDQHDTIVIRDNGRGLPHSLISEVGRYGFSHGKPEGKGLGLSFAQRTLSASGGNLVFQSNEGQGSQLSLLIPKRPQP